MEYICWKCGKRLTFEEINDEGITLEEYQKFARKASLKFSCPHCSSKTLFKARPKTVRTIKAGQYGRYVSF